MSEDDLVQFRISWSAGWKLKMFSTLKNWQHRIKEKEPEKVIVLQTNSVLKGRQNVPDKFIMCGE